MRLEAHLRILGKQRHPVHRGLLHRPQLNRLHGLDQWRSTLPRSIVPRNLKSST